MLTINGNVCDGHAQQSGTILEVMHMPNRSCPNETPDKVDRNIPRKRVVVNAARRVTHLDRVAVKQKYYLESVFQT